SGQTGCLAGKLSGSRAAYWPELSGEADGEADSDGEAASDGEADGLSSFFFDGEAVGDAFFVELELVLLVAAPVFLVPVEVVDFLVVAVGECTVVAVVSALCAQEAINATPARTAVNPSMIFFIINRSFGLE